MPARSSRVRSFRASTILALTRPPRSTAPTTGVRDVARPARRWRVVVAPISLARLAADKGFVHFDQAGQQLAIIFQRAAYPVHHAPHRSSTHFEIARCLHRRQPFLGVQHERDQQKPALQINVAVVENRAHCRAKGLASIPNIASDRLARFRYGAPCCRSRTVGIPGRAANAPVPDELPPPPWWGSGGRFRWGGHWRQFPSFSRSTIAQSRQRPSPTSRYSVSHDQTPEVLRGSWPPNVGNPQRSRLNRGSSLSAFSSPLSRAASSNLIKADRSCHKSRLLRILVANFAKGLRFGWFVILVTQPLMPRGAGAGRVCPAHGRYISALHIVVKP